MKESFFIILIIFIVIFLATGVMKTMSNDICTRQYGEGWRASGYNTKYCTNKNGDIKGF